MKAPSSGYVPHPPDGERRSINSELWHACAGPLVSLPPVGSLVVYCPQGHSEQVAASMQKESDGHIPNYPNLPSKLICQLHNVTLHADVETDQVYAQMTLQPVNTDDKDSLRASDLGLKQSKQPTEFFCKTLTASDTSTHGGFSVPRRAAEKIFPPLDFSIQPPAQELVARDLHDNVWTFRHIYRGQPKRHLLTTGWSVFVSAKRLFAGDSVLFIRDEKSQLLLGVRRANRQQAPMSSSVLSSDSMHIGVLAAAAHAASNHSPFTVFYNPRASPSEFVIPWSKYNKALYSTQVSLGMRFRMMFETEESGVRRYMGTIMGISDLDPIRWPNSQWRNLQVGWDESSVGERQNRVSIWEIEPVATPFFICPPTYCRPKRPRQPGILGEESDLENIKRALPWFGEETSIGDSPNSTIPGMGLVQWMTMQQGPEMISPMIQSEYYHPMAAATLQKLGNNETSKQLGSPQQALQPHQMQFNISQLQHPQQHEQLQQQQILLPQQQHHIDISQQQQQNHIHNSQQQQQHLHTQQQMLSQKVEQQHLQTQRQQHVHTPQQVLSQKVEQQHLQTQQQMPSLQVEQQQVLSQKMNLQHQTLQQLQQQPVQQLHQRLQQLQQQPQLHPQATLPLPQLAQQQQQQLQRLQQLQQPPAQLQVQEQRLQQPPQQVRQQPWQLQQQQQLLQTSQQFHQHQIQPPPPSQQHVPSQFLQHLHNQQKQHIQQSIQLPEIQGQTLQSSSGRSQVAVNMPLPAKAQSGFSDVPSGSASTSANSYPLQNVLSRANQCASTSEERPRYANMPKPNPSGAQSVMSVSNLVREPQVTSWFPSTKEPNQAALQTYLSGQLGQMETSSSSGASFSLTQTDAIVSQSFPSLPLHPSPFLLGDVSHDTDIPTDPRNNFLFGVNIESSLTVPSTSSPLLASSLSAGKDSQNHLSAGNMLPSFSTCKDVQPQISSPPGSQSFTVSDLAFNPGVASDGGMHDSSLLQRGSWQQSLPAVRTYTKVYKLGSVGRSIDVTRCKNYHELRCELARMFGLEGQLEDPQSSVWQLVFVDNEYDILLLGDDPWEEFVSCVRCIRILSPTEVLQMGQENLEPLNTIPLQQQTGSSSDGGILWRDSCDQNSTNPSAGSLEH